MTPRGCFRCRPIKAELRIRSRNSVPLTTSLSRPEARQRTLFDSKYAGSVIARHENTALPSCRYPGAAALPVLNYLPRNSLLVIDEIHVTLPQLQGCTAATARAGDPVGRFRLLRAPTTAASLRRFERGQPQTIYVLRRRIAQLDKSARCRAVVRPTASSTPVRMRRSQPRWTLMSRFACESTARRVLVTTLTKRWRRTDRYLDEHGIKVRYRFDIETVIASNHPRPPAREIRRAGRHHPSPGGLASPNLPGCNPGATRKISRSEVPIIQTVGRVRPAMIRQAILCGPDDRSIELRSPKNRRA